MLKFFRAVTVKDGGKQTRLQWSSTACDGVGKFGEHCPVGSAVITSKRTKEASLGSQIPAVLSNQLIKLILLLS